MVVVEKVVEMEEAVNIIILQIRKLRHRKFKYLAQGKPGICVRDWVYNHLSLCDSKVSNWCWVLGAGVKGAKEELKTGLALPWRVLEWCWVTALLGSPSGNDFSLELESSNVFAPVSFWKSFEKPYISLYILNLTSNVFHCKLKDL